MTTRRASDSHLSVRRATATDTGAVTSCVTAAFQPYVEHIGKPPSPMLVDYASLIAAGHVWIVERSYAIEGVLVAYERKFDAGYDRVFFRKQLAKM